MYSYIPKGTMLQQLDRSRSRSRSRFPFPFLSLSCALTLSPLRSLCRSSSVPPAHSFSLSLWLAHSHHLSSSLPLSLSLSISLSLPLSFPLSSPSLSLSLTFPVRTAKQRSSL